MDRNDHLYNYFLEQMGSLNDFLVRYNQDHRYTGLKPQQSNDDPDSARLLEAIAFFSAKTYYMAERNMSSFRNKFYQQLFPYFLTTLPATGIIQAVSTGTLTECMVLEKGMEFILETNKEKSFFFVTDSEITISKLNIVSLDSTPREAGGIKLWLDFHEIHQSTTPITALSIFVDYNGDTHYSFELFGYLRRCLLGVRVCYGDRIEIGSDIDNYWQDIDLPEFGPKPDKTEDPEVLHPIERERLFFSDPRSELFIQLKIDRGRYVDRHFSLEFVLSEPVPRGLRINRDCFQLHCVPILNIIRTPASGLICDGTQTRFPILHPNDNDANQLFKVIGVYKIDDNGMLPLVPGILDSESGTYDIDLSTGTDLDTKSFSYIDLHYPSAMSEPVTIHIDALWCQRAYNENRESRSTFRPYSRNGLGVHWDWRCPPMASSGAPSSQLAAELLLNLVVISYKRYLSFMDMQFILTMIGVSSSIPFKTIYSAFTGLRHEFRSVHGSRLTAGYIIYFLDFDWSLIDRESELFGAFIRHLESALNFWSTEREIHLVVEEPIKPSTPTHIGLN